MEPEVHIVERYMQLVKRCFTMTNVMLSGGKEIDLLALDPLSDDRYHIEVRVAIGRGFKIRLADTQTKSGRKHRRGMDTLNEIKFAPPVVVKAVTELFGSPDYRKVLVVWEVENESVIEESRKKYGIEMWKMPEVLNELVKEVSSRGYRDDILRTLQLVTLRNPAV